LASANARSERAQRGRVHPARGLHQRGVAGGDHRRVGHLVDRGRDQLRVPDGDLPGGQRGRGRRQRRQPPGQRQLPGGLPRMQPGPPAQPAGTGQRAGGLPAAGRVEHRQPAQPLGGQPVDQPVQPQQPGRVDPAAERGEVLGGQPGHRGLHRRQRVRGPARLVRPRLRDHVHPLEHVFED
jgi:hypothetical protein